MFRSLKKLFIGRPLATAEAIHQRLSNITALAVFSSDALSSVAYATEEILLVLVAAGAAAMTFSLPIALAIALLLVIVTASYRQTIMAYPSGGGAYIVSRSNLGELPGLVAASALLIDYVLTAAVSVSAGTAALGSAFPFIAEHKVLVGLFLVAAITVANLRGVRESGALFAIPTYAFVLSMASLILVGAAKWATGSLVAAAPDIAPEAGLAITTFLILRAFSSGCAALTGVEAISNGVPAFKEPAAVNARKTLGWMAAILATLFIGITLLSRYLGLVPAENQTLLSQLARSIYGDGTMYYFVQLATATILVVAANTSYADFPRLSSLLASDGFLPRQFANRGDRLAFSNGIVTLGLFTAALIVLFAGDTHRLIPLYAVGVFTSFTLSQTGMVRHWLRERSGRFRRNLMINATGATATAVVLAVIAATKLLAGAWMVGVVAAGLILSFKAVKGHYQSVARQLSLEGVERMLPARVKHNVLILVAGMHRGTLKAVEYAHSLSPDFLRAVMINVDDQAAERLRSRWDKWAPNTRLDIVDSPYRGIVQPLKEYVSKLDAERGDDIITLVIPEFVPRRWWEHLLHNQTALLIKLSFVFHPNVVIVNVPYHL